MQEWAEYSRVWAFCTQETIFRTLERFNEDLDNLGVPAAGEESRQIALAEDRAALNRTLCYIVTSFKDMREIFSLDPADIHYFVDAIQHAMRNEQAQSPIYNRFQDAFLAFRTAITRVDSAPDLSSLIEKLGENPVKRDTFSDIYEGELLGQEKVALATFRVTKPPDPQTWQRFHREILMWTNLQHENVLEIYGLQGDMCLVLPWVPVDAHAYLESNPQVNPHSLLLGAAAGLEYLHAHQPPIIHGDIRGANILVSESGAAQITGYGVVPFMVGASMDKSIDHLIAARWTAPELITPLENEESNGETPAIDTWTQASDVWSFGMTILAPFRENSIS
ncbi:hypothetical protein BOTBODRAFT_605959 [Botryobasidium botryosum FD-172 SS1]|uniref:Protein kinase domain-containing protein n=1 Tax=Botryobasidium botryosum (strain FD-172 SS1) TaxID=930990 RepID=A0A067MZU5_BOTB1|nr:hypothetical protein BOTBODRAFT_605959 [Botryobasidium botryosum FD-172 SS1]